MTACNSEGTVLVTGVSGLIGSAVVRLLTARGRAVLGMDRQRPASTRYPFALQDIGDANRLHEVMRQVDIRCVVHAGGASGPMVSPEAPARVSAVNIGGLVDVLEVARIHQLRRVVWLSSIAAYGPQPGDAPVHEDTVLRPTTVYGASKAAGEALLLGYAAEHGVDGVALRVASCYGPGRTTDCFVRLLIENALAGKPTRVADPTARTRQHVYVDDVADAICAALAVRELPRRIYNIGPGMVLDSRQVADAVGSTIPGVQLVDDPAAPLPNVFRIGPLDIGAARSDLGFDPRTSLAEGALSYRNWVVARQAGVA